MARPTCCVIGAGAAGLAAFYELRAREFEVRCFEATDRIGGHWNTDYDALHLITGRDVTGYDYFPMPETYPLFPSRDQVLDYLRDFARESGLGSDIEFGASVTTVTPVGQGTPSGAEGWTVRTSDGADCTVDAVVIATGHLWDSRVPLTSAEFTGVQYHSSEYRNVSDIHGERVLVVGAGNSGCDIAVDAAQARLRASISMRSGRIFQPKSLYGRVRSDVDQLRGLPPDEQDLLTRHLIEIVLGKWSDYPGMPEPNYVRLSDGPPIVNSLLPYWVQHGRIKVVPEVLSFVERSAHFADGTSEEFDTVIWATGFNVRLPFLDDGLLDWVAGVPLRLAGGVVPLGPVGLFFVGLAAPRGPQIAIYPEQARLVARILELPRKIYTSPALEAELLAHQAPESRIDVLRHIWQSEMARAQSVVEKMACHQPS